MKKLSAIFAVLAVVFAVSSSFAQPQVVVHVTGGYNLPMPDFKGDITTIETTTDHSLNTAYQKSGFNVGADGKYFLGKKRNVGITLSLGYNSFTSSSFTSATSSNTYLSKANVFAAGLGVEYDFMPKGKTNVFIGAEFTGNFLSGKFTFTPANGTAKEYTLTSASRFGFQGNFGVDFNLSKNVGAVLGMRYNLMNLIGKKSDTATVLNGEHAATLTEYGLNDAAYTTSGGTSVNAMNASYLSIYAGVSFYFNRPKSMKK